MEIEIRNFPPDEIYEKTTKYKMLFHTHDNDGLDRCYTENNEYIFKENKERGIFEQVGDKRELDLREKGLLQKKCEQKKRNDEYERIFIASLPAIQAFEKSMQCGNRSEGQGIGI